MSEHQLRLVRLGIDTHQEPVEILEIANHRPAGRGAVLAAEVLDQGRAWAKFQAICEAQGGMREPPAPTHRWEFPAARLGQIRSIDNRQLARVAKLAGAPSSEGSLREAGVTRIETTNSIDHSTNAIEIADLLVPSLEEFAG